MREISIEQIGGVVGAGGAGSHVHMRGRVAWEALSAADRATIDRLFAARRPIDASLSYRITRTGAAGIETVDARADEVPPALIAGMATELD